MRAYLFGIAIVSVLASALISAAQDKGAKRSTSEAVLAYREAANFQNNGAFEVAAEEWQKFLKNFSSDPLAPKAQHYLGVCQLQLKQYPAAIATLEALARNYPQFELLEETLFDLASSHYALASAGNAEHHAKAAVKFAELLERFPKGKSAQEALFYQGESLYANDKKADAAHAYDRLLKEYPNSKRRAEALYALGVAQQELGQHQEAGKTYDAFLTEFANSRLANEVWLRKGETLLQVGDSNAAEKLFGQLASRKDFEEADNALSRQAYCLAQLERHEEAGAAYARLASDHEQSPHAADATISAGRCFYRADNLPAAKQWLAKAIARQDGHSTEAAHWLCRLLMKSGSPSAAAELAKKELSAASGSFAANLQLDQADALYEVSEKRTEAYQLYVKFVRENPRHELMPQALYNAAFTALGLKDYDEGLRHARAFLTDFHKHELAADVQYVAAECQLQLKEYDAAANSYRKLVEQHGNRSDADAWRVRLGLVSHLQKDHEATLAVLSPVVDRLKSPDARAEAYFLIGASQFHLNQFSPASQSLAASLKINPKWRQADEAVLLMARAQAKQGKPSEAKANLELLLAQFPQSRVRDEAHYRLAEILDGQGKQEEAIGEFNFVATEFGDSPYAPYALYGKGWTEYRSKAFTNGADSFTSFLRRWPEHQLAADAAFGRALCRRQAGDAKGAIADIDAYLKTNPDRTRRSDALYERGLAQASRKDFAGTVTTLDSLLSSDPGYPATDKVLYEIGWALKAQEKHREAAEKFAQLAEIYPSSKLATEAFFHVAEHHYDNKEFVEAERAYANVKAKQADGELAEKATYKLGWTNFQLKDYADALKQFREQLTAFPTGPLAAEATFMQAECLFRQEDYAAAWPAYVAALKVKPSTPTIEALTLLHAGQSASQLKKWDEAMGVLSQLATKQPDSPLMAEASYELGWARQNLGRTEEALVDYEAAASKSRDHVGARARFMRGELLFAQKKHDEASRDFQRAMYGYGGDQASTETRNWQAKSGYEAGRCAEVQLSAAAEPMARQKQLADARRFYSFVAEKHAEHELASEARKRLAALGQMEQRETKAKDGKGAKGKAPVN
jgi:cellulose synthase operon protein C